MRQELPLVVAAFDARSDAWEACVEALAGAADVVDLRALAGDQRSAALAHATALLTWNDPAMPTDDDLRAMTSLRIVQFLAAGVDQVDLTRFPMDAVLCGNVGAYAEPIAEHAVAMALSLAKRLPQKHAELAHGEFLQDPPTHRIDGSICAVLGLGGIGAATARLMRALGARIHAINSTGLTDEPVEWCGTLDDLDEVLSVSDAVVIALPLTSATRGLIGRSQLERMKPDAVLVNVARAAIVDEAALYEHLRSQPDFSAGIDVWWQEPFGGGTFGVGHPFFELPNLLGSPHNSGAVPGIEVIGTRRAAENVARFVRGEPIRGVVRREDYAT